MNSRSILDSVFERISSTLSSLHRQAPGARMIGEFAVKQSIKEVTKNLQNLQGGKQSDADTKKVHDDNA